MKKSLGAKTLLYPTPVLIVGTYDKKNKPNAMAVAWGGICCSKPPSIAVSIRAATYTHGSIKERKAFTVSIPSEDFVSDADYFGIASGRDEDKFSASGLTPVKSDLVDAPFVKEFPMVIECILSHTLELGLHTQFVGEIKDVKIEETELGDDGGADIEKIRPIIYAPGNQAYYGVGHFVGDAFSIGRK